MTVIDSKFYLIFRFQYPVDLCCYFDGLSEHCKNVLDIVADIFFKVGASFLKSVCQAWFVVSPSSFFSVFFLDFFLNILL